MEVTISGVPRARRQQLSAIITQLRGVYSGALVVARTAAIVTELPVDWTAPKLVVAAQTGTPVVSVEWLFSSLEHGFLLAFDQFQLIPQHLGRRSSAASTSAAAGLPPATAAGEPPGSASFAAPPLPRSATPASPERLRGEACQVNAGPLKAAFLEQPEAGAASPQAGPRGGSPAGTAGPEQRLQLGQQGHALMRDELLHEQQPSPASPISQQSNGGLAGGEPSPLGGSQLQLLEVVFAGLPQAGTSRTGSAVTAAARTQQQEPEAEGSRDFSPAPCLSGDAAVPTRVTSASGRTSIIASSGGGGDCGSGTAGAETGSDAKVARFLSRLPCVTLVRGSCMPRLPTGGSGGSSTAGSSGGTCGGGAGAPPNWRCSSASSGASPGRPVLHCLQLQWEPEGQRTPALQQAGSVGPASSGGEGGGSFLGRQLGRTPISELAAAGATRSIPLSMPQHWRNSSVLRMRQSLQAQPDRLPATTLVRLGPSLQRPPARSTLEGVAERHGSDSRSPPPSSPLEGQQGQQGQGQGPLPAAFHASAEALPQGGPEMTFVAGDPSHGASILYDILEDGTRVHALTLVQSIYALNGEAWMEHRYLFSREDLVERPAWAAALWGHAIRAGEVLLSSGSYHSPMHLVSGEFRLAFPGRAMFQQPPQLLSSKGAGCPRQTAAQAASVTTSAQRQEQAIYTCRRAFDAATGTVVPLRRALEGFAALA